MPLFSQLKNLNKMKKIVIIIIINIAFISPAVFANDDSINQHLANTVSIIFKMPGNNLVNTKAYYKKDFVYKGITVAAYKSNTCNWIGFFKQISLNDLSSATQKSIAKKYKNYSVIKVDMYIDANGHISYFAQLAGNRKCFILKIEPDNKMHIFNCSQPRK